MAKILVINDKDKLMSFSAMLKTMIPDCAVITASSESEGIAKAKAESPDTVVLDVKNSEMGSFEICRKLKSDLATQHIPVIMVTASEKDAKSQFKSLKAGADAYLAKPYEDYFLAAQVKTALRIKKAEERLRQERDLLEEMVKERTKALRESEEKFAKAFQCSPVWVAISALSDGRNVEINETFSKMTGYSREEAIGRTSIDLGLWPDPEERGKVVNIVKEQNGLRNYEIVLNTKTGKPIHCLLSSEPIEVNGEACLINVLMDITERRMMEEALRKSEEEARRLAHGNEVMAEIGRIISSTLNIEEVYERFTEEVSKLIPVDRTAFTIINSQDRTAATVYESGIKIPTRRPGEIFPLAGSATEKAEQAKKGLIIKTDDENEVASSVPGLLPVFKSGIRSVMMIPLISRDRAIGVLNLQSIKPNVYAEKELIIAERVGNQIAGAIGNAQLFSEHERAEKALRESEERYRNILDNIEEGYYEVDLRGKFTFFSDSLCKILGYSREELMGMNNWQYMDKETHKTVYQAFYQVFITGEPNRCVNWEVIRKDGSRKIHEVSVSLIKEAKGGPVGFRGIVRDVTERKKAEEEKRTLEEQLRQSQKMEAIGSLAGGIAHDFNNFLTVMRAHSQLALMELKEGDKFKEPFEAIENATGRAANLVKQLLAFSRRQVLEMKVFDLNILIRDLDKMLHRVIGEDIELMTLLADDLGRVKADHGQIEQIVLNLAVNARDAMPSGGKLTIETANVELDEIYARSHVAVKPGRYVMLSVSDTGVGMTPEVRERVFEPFFTTKEKGKGTGLGLSTVFGIVKQSGGNIWVYSEPGQGTTFKVYLPLVDEPITEEREKGALGLFRESGVILVVEDDEEVRKAVLEVLRNRGYSALEAADKEGALLICRHYKDTIHLMITDVVMPKISGPELAKHLAVFHPEMKVLYMSGYTDNAIIHHGVLDKGVNYIQKPFTIDGLSRKVREILIEKSN